MARKAWSRVLDFDLQLWIWQGARTAWRWLGRDATAAERAAAAVPLAERRDRLQRLARAVSGHPLVVRATRELPGCDGKHLLLPETADWYCDPQDNHDALWLLTVLLAEVAAQARWGEPGADGELAWARSQLARYPGLAEVLERHEAAEARRGVTPWVWPDDEAPLPALAFRQLARFAPLEAVPPRAGQDVAQRSAEGSEAEAPVQEDVRRVELDAESPDRPPTHTFEKVETLDEYHGSQRDTDGEDQLDEQLEAMRELKMQDVVRVDDVAHSVYRSELLMADALGDVASQGERGIPYDEWDPKRRAYRKDWCRVLVSPCQGQDPAWYQRTLEAHRDTIFRLKRELMRSLSARERVRHQKDGPELDLNAAVDHLVRLRSGQPPLEELYLSTHPRRRELAVLILLDLSLSTDSYVENRRVLDVCKESLLVLCEVLGHYRDPFEIAAFFSHTRNQVHYRTLKSFRQSWSSAKPYLGALEPQGYTRIGPALRHATRQLAAQPASQRVLLLLSDGKPNDYDRYEGRYGIGDIRQALREAEREGIHAHALAVDKQAQDYLPQMLGPNRFAILRHPQELPQRMGEFFVRLARRA